MILNQKYNGNYFLNSLNTELFFKAMYSSEYYVASSILLGSIDIDLDVNLLEKFGQHSHLHSMPYHVFVWLGSLKYLKDNKTAINNAKNTTLTEYNVTNKNTKVVDNNYDYYAKGFGVYPTNWDLYFNFITDNTTNTGYTINTSDIVNDFSKNYIRLIDTSEYSTPSNNKLVATGGLKTSTMSGNNNFFSFRVNDINILESDYQTVFSTITNVNANTNLEEKQKKLYELYFLGLNSNDINNDIIKIYNTIHKLNITQAEYVNFGYINENEFINKFTNQILEERKKKGDIYTEKISDEAVLSILPSSTYFDFNKIFDSPRYLIPYQNITAEGVKPIVKAFLKQADGLSYVNEYEKFNKDLKDNIGELAIKDSNPKGEFNISAGSKEKMVKSIDDVLDYFTEDFILKAEIEFRKFTLGTSLHETFSFKGLIKAITTLSIEDFNLTNEKDSVLFKHVFGYTSLTKNFPSHDKIQQEILIGLYKKFQNKYERIINSFIGYNVLINNPIYETKQTSDLNITNLQQGVYFNTYVNAIKNTLLNVVNTKDADNNKNNEEEQRLYDLKFKTYYNVKNIFDNWISVTVSDTSEDKNLFYNLNKVDYCDDVAIKTDTKRDIFDYVQILDRTNKPVGDDIITNLEWISSFFSDNLKNTSNQVNNISLYGFLSAFAEKHNFLLHSLPAYIDINGASGINDIQDMFTPFDTIDNINSSPTFLLQFVGSMTSKLNLPDDDDKIFQDKAHSFCLDSLDELPADFSGNYNNAAFIVEFGNQDQQIFNNIEIDQSEFQNTEESFQIIENLADKGAQIASGDLYEIYTSRSYTATVNSMGNAMIQPLLFFYLKGLPMFYGTYWITNVVHTITPNDMSTQFQGVRQPFYTSKTNDKISFNYLQKLTGKDSNSEEISNNIGTSVAPTQSELNNVLFADNNIKYTYRDALTSSSKGLQNYEETNWNNVKYTIKDIRDNIAYAVKIMDILKTQFGIYPKINSFYRNVTTNNAVGGSAVSYHLIGAAIDFDYDGTSVDNIDAFVYLRDNHKQDFDQLIWEIQKSSANNKRRISNLHIGLNKKFQGKHQGSVFLKDYSNTAPPKLASDILTLTNSELISAYG